MTGFVIGGIPPIGHQQTINTLIDEDLLGYTEIWATAGTPRAVFKLKSYVLIKLTHEKIIPIK